jgi:hypothetical protein
LAGSLGLSFGFLGLTGQLVGFALRLLADRPPASEAKKGFGGARPRHETSDECDDIA